MSEIASWVAVGFACLLMIIKYIFKSSNPESDASIDRGIIIMLLLAIYLK